MSMEVTLGCNTAAVSVLDSSLVPVVEFANVAVMGNTGLCDAGNFGRNYSVTPRADVGSDF
jgi:hypothetical protein